MKTPEFTYLKPWKRPQCYFGSQWNGWFVFLWRNRDSDDLANSNFECGLAAIRAVASKEPVPPPPSDCPALWDAGDTDMATVQVVSENHWAVGWVGWIAIHCTDTAALNEAERLLEKLEGYPVLDEDDWSRREDETATRIWRDCYDARERVEYIREHSSQFEFQSFSDLLGCVRGKYFAGYASELIN